jgi:hypothetical protein
VSVTPTLSIEPLFHLRNKKSLKSISAPAYRSPGFRRIPGGGKSPQTSAERSITAIFPVPSFPDLNPLLFGNRNAANILAPPFRSKGKTPEPSPGALRLRFSRIDK